MKEIIGRYREKDSIFKRDPEEETHFITRKETTEKGEDWGSLDGAVNRDLKQGRHADLEGEIS